MGEGSYEVPTWELLYELCVELANRIRDSGFQPDLIIGVARGGWIPARLLSDFLENPNVASIKVEFYVDIGRTSSEPIITQPCSAPVEGKRILLVDDVADSGRSLSLVKDSLLRQGAKEIRIACLYYKPWSIIKPEYYIKETTSWIIFPHEVKETARKLWNRMRGEGMDPDSIGEELMKIGIRPLLIRKFVEEFRCQEGMEG
ncbi:phosphoribosyltransferase [Candidatus Bathyarchaeota archaeon]|nr:phosphoribosyltransferase [Candidatus Bathyarchaeota archaeon]MBS7627723.1 phosphoribosyltransferase [Candidatus Bathyarchaeota archaeon]